MDSFLFSILWLSAGSFVVFFFRRVKHHAFIHNMQLRVLRIKFMLYIYFYYYYFNLLFDLCPSLCGNSAPADLCLMYCYYQNFVCSHRKLINALKIFLRFELMDCDPVFLFVWRMRQIKNKYEIQGHAIRRWQSRDAVANTFPHSQTHNTFFFLFFPFDFCISFAVFLPSSTRSVLLFFNYTARAVVSSLEVTCPAAFAFSMADLSGPLRSQMRHGQCENRQRNSAKGSTANAAALRGACQRRVVRISVGIPLGSLESQQIRRYGRRRRCIQPDPLRHDFVVHVPDGHHALQVHAVLILRLEEALQRLAVGVDVQRGVRSGALVGVLWDALQRRPADLQLMSGK